MRWANWRFWKTSGSFPRSGQPASSREDSRQRLRGRSVGDKSVSLGAEGELNFLPEPGPGSKRDSQELNRVFGLWGSSGVPSPPWEGMHLRLVERRRPADGPV